MKLLNRKKKTELSKEIKKMIDKGTEIDASMKKEKKELEAIKAVLKKEAKKLKKHVLLGNESLANLTDGTKSEVAIERLWDDVITDFTIALFSDIKPMIKKRKEKK